MRLPLLCTLALAIAASPLHAQTPADNDAVRAAARAFDDAQVRRDRAVLEQMLAPDFLVVRGSGRIGGKSDFIQGFTDPNAHLEPPEIRDPLFIRPSTDTAVVGGEAWVRSSENGNPFRYHYRYANVFAKRDGRWVVVYVQVTPLPAP